jgi:pimeloyl-ACP methyl ester carboxylesterase
MPATLAPPDDTDDAKLIPSDAPITCPVRVYLLRGLWDFYSFGLDDLAIEMRANIGVDASSVSGPDWKSFVDPIVAEYEAAGHDFPLVLIGHSFGADDALNLAHGLKERNIRVNLILLFDATDPPPVPDNVERVIHLYIRTNWGDAFPRTFAGNAVVAEAGNTFTVIENILVNNEYFGPGVEDVTNHFNLESDPTLHLYATQVVGQLCP